MLNPVFDLHLCTVNLSADNAQRLKKLSVGSLSAQLPVTRSKTAAGMRAKVCNQLPQRDWQHSATS